jgi:hypothetical protein
VHSTTKVDVGLDEPHSCEQNVVSRRFQGRRGGRDERQSRGQHLALLYPIKLQALVSRCSSRRGRRRDSLLVVGIGVGTEVPQDEIPRLLRCEPEQDVDPIDVSRVETDGVSCLGRRIPELEEVVGHLRRSGHLARTLESEDEDVEDETVVLEDEGRELKSSDHSEGVDVRHVLVGEDDVVLARTVISLSRYESVR